MICNLCEFSAQENFTYENYDFYKCTSESCGHVFVSPPPSTDELTRLYSSLEPSQANANGFTLFEDYQKDPEIVRGYYRQSRIKFLRGRTQALSRKDSSILDVGCSSGMFLVALRDEGYTNVSGFDLSSQMCEFVREQHGIPCFNDFDLVKDSNYSLITCYDVLEHSNDSRDLLAKLVNKLAAGGELLIAVPNFGSAYAKFSGRHWPWLIPPIHLQYFNKKSLDRLINQKLTPMSMDTYYGSTYLYLLVHHLMKAFGKSVPSTSRSRSRLANVTIKIVELALKSFFSPFSICAKYFNGHLELRSLSRRAPASKKSPLF